MKTLLACISHKTDLQYDRNKISTNTGKSPANNKIKIVHSAFNAQFIANIVSLLLFIIAKIIFCPHKSRNWEFGTLNMKGLVKAEPVNGWFLKRRHVDEIIQRYEAKLWT